MEQTSLFQWLGLLKVTIVADRVRFMKITSDPLPQTKDNVKNLTTTTTTTSSSFFFLSAKILTTTTNLLQLT